MKILNFSVKSVVSIAMFVVGCYADAAQNGRASMMPAVDSARMPTMPTFSLNTVGNPAVTTVNQPAEVNSSHNNVVPSPTPTPTPTPVPECSDGGVRNSDYTVQMCMKDVSQCINTGALQGGLHDLFSEDVRNAIMGGMKICQLQIDKCITDVRVDCRNIYIESNDVWLDFNSRVIQPEYYNFVLRKTGLTPNQAENTCLLLDRNTYGPAFSAVSDVNAVNGEYSRKVGAYNVSNGGVLTKKNPQGVEVNTEGYDGNRGHYARWDAANAECLIRVAAYNKDKLITNSWLFGAVGNDKPAEVWARAGSTFTCNKDLFDFSSLLNDTRTTAVVGVGGGIVVGGVVGGVVGAHNYKKKTEACQDEKYRNKLADYIRNVMHQDINIAKNYVGENIDFNNLGEDDCEKIYDLYAKVNLYERAINYCYSRLKKTEREEIISKLKVSGKLVCDKEEIKTLAYNEEEKEKIIAYVDNCTFKSLDKLLISSGEDNLLCVAGKDCVDSETISKDLEALKSLLKQLESGVGMKATVSKGKEIGKGVAIGAATGAGVGGIITGITALVEKSNITCRVGDGLNSVSMGKAHTIDSLKDFYVKWNLHLPDTVAPTSAVVDRASWQQACSQFNSKLMDCPKVQINLKDEKGKYDLVQSACRVSGNLCTTNDAVMISNGIK